MQYTPITKVELEQALKDGQTSFVYRTFDFPVEIHSNIATPVLFDNCEFKEEVSFANAAFLETCTIVGCHFHQNVSFALTSFERFAKMQANVFYARLELKRTIFRRNVNWSQGVFQGEVFIDHAHFGREVSWYRAQFTNNFHMHKAYMGTRVDFSYATFSPEHTTSFFSSNRVRTRMDGKAQVSPAPVLIFRYIYFPRKTLFTNIDLSCSIFQDCYLIPIIFKNCTFREVAGRQVFYQETAKRYEMATEESMYARIIKGIDTISIRLNTPDRQDLQINDIVTFYNASDPRQRYTVFPTWIYHPSKGKDIFEHLKSRLPYIDLEEYKSFIKGVYQTQDIQTHGLMAFSFKLFDERRHWQNLEDINRQMKRSLEESRDWQQASDFYVGEMKAMIKRLGVMKEKPLYQYFLQIYGWLSGYCESFTHIAVHMVLSFSASMLILLSFRSDLSFSALFDTNFKLFVPVFGNNTATLHELALLPWQNVVMEIQVVWYYLLWLFLALTMQRKFKR